VCARLTPVLCVMALFMYVCMYVLATLWNPNLKEVPIKNSQQGGHNLWEGDWWQCNFTSCLQMRYLQKFRGFFFRVFLGGFFFWCGLAHPKKKKKTPPFFIHFPKTSFIHMPKDPSIIIVWTPCLMHRCVISTMFVVHVLV
jgi:hypothetical protein